MKKRNNLPAGCTEAEIKAIADHYDSQTDDDAVLEDERYLALEIGGRIVPIGPSVSQQIYELAREKKTTVEKLINALLKKSILKAA
ncbi:MAG: hypothetical protein WA705_17035 [Candidatus Ozemobacteraceae bacterium]